MISISTLPPIMSAKQFAQFADVSAMKVTGWIRKGMPHKRVSGKVRINVRQALRWKVTRDLAESAESPQARLLRAKAVTLEHKNRRRCAELAEVAPITDAVISVSKVIETNLRALPARVAKQIAVTSNEETVRLILIDALRAPFFDAVKWLEGRIEDFRAKSLK